MRVSYHFRIYMEYLIISFFLHVVMSINLSKFADSFLCQLKSSLNPLNFHLSYYVFFFYNVYIVFLNSVDILFLMSCYVFLFNSLNMIPLRSVNMSVITAFKYFLLCPMYVSSQRPGTNPSCRSY